MKNLLLSMTIALFISFFPFCEVTNALPSENDYGLQQKSDWEYLGDIVGVTESNRDIRLSGQLYVRVIGEKEFYQVRVKSFLVGEIKICSVSFGSFTCWGDKYNAKFYADTGFYPGTYYFNL